MSMLRRLLANWLPVYAFLYIVFLYLPVLLLPVFSVNTSASPQISALRLDPAMVPGPAEDAGADRRDPEQPDRRHRRIDPRPPSSASARRAPSPATASRGQRAVSGLIMAPLVLPEIIVAISLLIVLLQLGLSLSLFTVVLGHVLICVPYSVSVLISGFEGFDRSLEEASADLGESAFGTFRRVTLPMVAPAIISSLLVSFTISLDEFIMAFFLTGTEATLPIYIWGQLRFAAKLPGVLALGTLLLVGSFILLTIAEILRRRAERRTRMTGAAIA